MLSFTRDILATIGAALVGFGLSGAIAFALFKFRGERWVNAKFEERLAAYRPEQQKEIENFKFNINKLMDRATKLHQREFEVLPEIWSKLNDAFGATQAACWWIPFDTRFPCDD